MSIREEIAERNEDALVADGFDEAIIGIGGRNSVVIYDTNKCIDILIEQGMDICEAVEYFDFNVEGSYVGEFTPIFITILGEQQ